MPLSIIVAMSKNRVIGRNGQLPWHIPEDLRRFKQITLGHPIIMGRKTFESIGKPLPGRENIVITRNKHFKAEGMVVCHSLEEALSHKSPFDNPSTGSGHRLRASGEGHGEPVEPEPCNDRMEQFVIGGAEIFREAYPLADKIYLTLIEKNVEGDAFFPKTDLEKDFEVIEKSPPVISLKEKIPYRFIILARQFPSAA